MRISDWSSDVCSSDLATIGQVGPDDLSLRKVPRQSDRIPALVSPRPKIRDHSPPPGFGRCVMHAFHRASLLVSHSYHALLLPDQNRSENYEYDDRSTVLARSEEHTSELQSLMRNSYAVFCL